MNHLTIKVNSAAAADEPNAAVGTVVPQRVKKTQTDTPSMTNKENLNWLLSVAICKKWHLPECFPSCSFCLCCKMRDVIASVTAWPGPGITPHLVPLTNKLTG